MKEKIENLVIDNDIYPRIHINHKTIDAYTEALKAGAKFPPIEVQKIIDNGEEKIIVLDGLHRLEAYKKYNEEIKQSKLDEQNNLKPITEIDVVYWNDNILDKKEWLNKLREEAIRKNLAHGDRLTNEDKKMMCRRMAEEDKDIKITINEFARIFGVSKSTINGWISDIRARQRGTRNNLIYRLNFMGWTQEMIAEKVGMSREGIRDIINGEKSNFGKIANDYKSGKSIEEIAKFYGLDLITTWTIILQGKDDLTRFKMFGRKEYQNDAPKLYNIWNFTKRDPRLGVEIAGNIAGQIAMNVLYYYTNQGDLVIDPMAGGGSTIDASLVMGRKCLAYDINPIRDDIIKHDITNGFPKINKKAKLIFLDPPYWKQKRGEYSNHETNLANLKLDEFYNVINKIFKDAKNVLEKNGYIAIIVSPTQENNKIYDHAFEFYKLLENNGYTFINRIIVPYSAEQAKAYHVNQAKNGKYMLKLYRDLLIFKNE